MDIILNNNQQQKIIANNIKAYTHKKNEEEIFIVGMTVVSNNKAIVRCSLADYHQHYDDVTNCPQLINPMVILESCRQAETYIVHQLFSVDSLSKFILKNWRLTLVKENYIKIHRSAFNAFDIHIESSQIVDSKTKLRKNQYYFLIKVNEVIVAKAEFDVSYINNASYSLLRGKASKSYNKRIYNIPRLSPNLVGYLSPYNVMLSSFEKYNGEYQALINVNYSNVTYNDHAQDHITGMNLVESAKQFCFCYLSVVMKLENSKYQVGCIEAEYYSYVELNSHAYVRMKEITISNDGSYKFTLHVIQDEKIKAKCEIKLINLKEKN